MPMRRPFSACVRRLGLTRVVCLVGTHRGFHTLSHWQGGLGGVVRLLLLQLCSRPYILPLDISGWYHWSSLVSS